MRAKTRVRDIPAFSDQGYGIMSNDCTTSGLRVWLWVDALFVGLLVVELSYLSELFKSNPDLGNDVALIGSTGLLGTFAGLGMMHQGLTNKNFDMRMRVALATMGAFLGAGALLTSAAMAFALP